MKRLHQPLQTAGLSLDHLQDAGCQRIGTVAQQAGDGLIFEIVEQTHNYLPAGEKRLTAENAEFAGILRLIFLCVLRDLCGQIFSYFCFAMILSLILL
jgi:hypothetical protein